MLQKYELTGHLVAFLTVLIWGVTFVSTKVLLEAFTPVEILFIRFSMGYLALAAAFPKFMKFTDLRLELLFAGAGLCGVTLYFLFENIALTYTMASNVGVLVSIAPFLTAMLAWKFLHTERPGCVFFVGFACAIAGISMIYFNGAGVLKLNPLGDALALLAAFVWAIYSVLIRKIGGYRLNTILVTRRAFFYGLVFMLPVISAMGFSSELEALAKPRNERNALHASRLRRHAQRFREQVVPQQYSHLIAINGIGRGLSAAFPAVVHHVVVHETGCVQQLQRYRRQQTDLPHLAQLPRHKQHEQRPHHLSLTCAHMLQGLAQEVVIVSQRCIKKLLVAQQIVGYRLAYRAQFIHVQSEF